MACSGPGPDGAARLARNEAKGGRQTKRRSLAKRSEAWRWGSGVEIAEAKSFYRRGAEGRQRRDVEISDWVDAPRWQARRPARNEAKPGAPARRNEAKTRRRTNPARPLPNEPGAPQNIGAQGLKPSRRPARRDHDAGESRRAKRSEASHRGRWADLSGTSWLSKVEQDGTPGCVPDTGCATRRGAKRSEDHPPNEPKLRRQTNPRNRKTNLQKDLS
jgi:hypothetical protein